MAVFALPTDADNPELLLAGYAKQQELDGLFTLFTAHRYYPAKVISPLIDLLMEVNG